MVVVAGLLGASWVCGGGGYGMQFVKARFCGYSRRPPVGRLTASKGYPCDLVYRLDVRRFSSPTLVFTELLETVLGDL